MRADLLLRLLAEETGEQLYAMDFALAAGWVAREPVSPPAKPPATVAVIPLQGILTANGFRYMGRQLTPGMNTFRAQVATAAASADVGAIVIDVDSPGGTVAGTPETAEAVKAAAAIKPVVAMVDNLNASAAYWITSQAGKIWMTPSAEVGSIGVMANHVEVSGALEQAGIKPTIIRSKSAQFKNEANPFEPLSETAIAALQARADELEDDFVATIAHGRKATADTVRATYGQGRMLSAERAIAAGMADKVGTMAGLLTSLQNNTGASRRRFSSFAFD